jgi:hypothetical protein
MLAMNAYEKYVWAKWWVKQSYWQSLFTDSFDHFESRSLGPILGRDVL